MIDERFVFIGSLLSFVGTFVYIRAIFAGQVKPNVVTWGLWATAPMLVFAAQLYEGAGLRSVLTFTVGFGPLLVVFAALIKKDAFVKVIKMDYVFGTLSMIGLILWLITGEGVLAIIFAILADGLAAVPTIRKLYFEPETENGTIFGFGVIGAAITLLTISDWRFEEFGFSLYILLVNMIMFAPTFWKFIVGKKKVLA
jgi:hypothetical protein